MDVLHNTCTQYIFKTTLMCRVPRVNNIKNRSFWTNILDTNRIEGIKLDMIRQTYKYTNTQEHTDV